jgi:hypothetical protein
MPAGSRRSGQCRLSKLTLGGASIAAVVAVAVSVADTPDSRFGFAADVGDDAVESAEF